MSLAPIKPPKTWFLEKPKDLKPNSAKYIGSEATGDQGRIAAYYFTWDQCLEEGNGSCWKPEKSQNDYQMFHQGTVETAEGDVLSVGTVGAGGGHAPFTLDAKTAAAVYANTDNQRFIARLYEDEVGGYLLGAFVPEVTEEQIAEVRRSPLSADFRWRKKAPRSSGGHFTGYDNIGPWLVTRPGFPLARAASLATALEQHEPMTTAPLGDEPCCEGCATKTAAVHPNQDSSGPGSLPGGLQVGAPMPDGQPFQGFEDGPVGPQMEAMGMTLGGGQPEAAGPDPAHEAQMQQMQADIRTLMKRVDELEGLMTGQILTSAEAPDLILNEESMMQVEEFDDAMFGGYHVYEDASAR